MLDTLGGKSQGRQCIGLLCIEAAECGMLHNELFQNVHYRAVHTF